MSILSAALIAAVAEIVVKHVLVTFGRIGLRRRPGRGPWSAS